MDFRSEAVLAHVHPDLARVIRNSAQVPQPFAVILGKRTISAEEAALASGHSATLHSRHLPDHTYATAEDPDGVSCAVDVDCLVNGTVDPKFAKGKEQIVFGQIAKQVQASADELGIPIQWGGAAIGAWTPGKPSHFRDFDHFQLTWAAYP